MQFGKGVKVFLLDFITIFAIFWMQKEYKMSNIPNTEYITIKKDGVFVGGQPATYYRGKKVHSQSLTTSYFLYIQEKFPIIEEFHVLSSKTDVKLYNINEQPSQQDGKYTWCRVKFTDGKTGNWIPNLIWNNAVETYCYCVADISANAEFRKKLFLKPNENQR